MTLKEKTQRAAASAVLEKVVKYVKKNPEENLRDFIFIKS